MWLHGLGKRAWRKEFVLLFTWFIHCKIILEYKLSSRRWKGWTVINLQTAQTAAIITKVWAAGGRGGGRGPAWCRGQMCHIVPLGHEQRSLGITKLWNLSLKEIFGERGFAFHTAREGEWETRTEGDDGLTEEGNRARGYKQKAAAWI